MSFSKRQRAVLKPLASVLKTGSHLCLIAAIKYSGKSPQHKLLFYTYVGRNFNLVTFSVIFNCLVLDYCYMDMRVAAIIVACVF